MKRLYACIVGILLLGLVALTVMFPVFAQVVAAILAFVLVFGSWCLIYPLIERDDETEWRD